MTTCCVIVAGGRSSRMGRTKAFEMIGGHSIIARVVAALARQCDAIAINSNDSGEGWQAFDLPIIPDLCLDIGTPLAGVHAALSYATENGFSEVLTVPSDTPFLPSDLLARLSATRASAAIAASGGRSHYLTGLWSCGLLPGMQYAVEQQPTPRMQDWAKMCNAAIVEWPCLPSDPFFNVNTPEELAEAERVAEEFSL